MRLSTKVLAATLATCAQDFAATSGSLTCEEAVTACTYEIARLKSPLHIVLEIKSSARLSTNKKGRLIKGDRKHGARLSEGLARVKIYAA